MFSMDVKIKTRAWVSLQHRRGKPTQESMFWLVTMKSHEEYVLSLLGACESCAECTLEGFICKLEENYIYLLSTSSHLSGLTQQEITFLAHSGRACCEVSRLLEVPTLEPADEVRCCPVLHPWRRLLQKRLIEKKMGWETWVRAQAKFHTLFESHIKCYNCTWEIIDLQY